jgi:predicted nucleic acid-binding Zn ribbon protein
MSDQPRATCPECGEESERLLSGGAGFLFKGEGFYITDYRSDSYKKEASKEKSVGSTEESKAGAEKKEKAPSAGAGKNKPPTSAPSSSDGSPGSGS